MEMKKRRKIAKKSEDKASILAKANLILTQLSLDDLIKLSPESRRILRQFSRHEETLAYRKLYLNKEHEEYLDIITNDMLEKLYLGMEMLFNRVNPFRRGQVDSIEFYAHDSDVSSLMKAALEGKMPGWQFSEVQKDIRSLPWTKQVWHAYIETEDKQVLLKFFKSFNIENLERILEQHWLQKTTSVTPPVLLDNSEVSGLSGEDLTNFKYEKKEKLGWFWNIPVCVKSSILCLGDYIAPGTVQQEEKEKEKEERKETNCVYNALMGEDDSDDGLSDEQQKIEKRQSKTKRKKKRAKFTIEIKVRAFPISQMAIVRLICKYDVLADGVSDGN